MIASPTPADFAGPAETLVQWYDNGPDRQGRRHFKVWRVVDGILDAVFQQAVPDDFTAAEIEKGRTVRQFGPDTFFKASPSYGTCPHCGGTC